MSIGLGIVLIAIGAIFTYALNISVEWVNLAAVGYILMAAGLVVVIIGIILLARRRRSTSVTSTSIDPETGERISRRDSARPDSTVM